ncbi:hypothetical protein BGZ49_006343 [Haplosporangium sp. Z 27]|nr:hypothetical protein BGZ49_006343 [Haplosporangium sp. Z 27]
MVARIAYTLTIFALAMIVTMAAATPRFNRVKGGNDPIGGEIKGIQGLTQQLLDNERNKIFMQAPQGPPEKSRKSLFTTTLKHIREHNRGIVEGNKNRKPVMTRKE